MNNEKELFQKGIDAFNNQHFYDAHEYWEELWLDYKLTDASFIQGLIQLAVSYFHYFNGNLRGARSMSKKCLSKFEQFEYARGIDIKELKSQIINLQNKYSAIDNTSYNIDNYIIKLKIMHE